MNIRQFGTAAVAAVAFAASLAGSAWACGDKLVALGGGVGFQRVVVSRNPGHIILMLEPASGLDAANKRFNLVASLSLAGHEVFIAKNDEELRELRATEKPDLILVDAASTKQYDVTGAASGTGAGNHSGHLLGRGWPGRRCRCSSLAAGRSTSAAKARSS